jgi:hypothetical protein
LAAALPATTGGQRTLFLGFAVLPVQLEIAHLSKDVSLSTIRLAKKSGTKRPNNWQKGRGQ